MNTKIIYRPRKLWEEPAEDAEYIEMGDIAAYMKELLEKHPPEPFQPVAYWNKDGKMLEIYWSNNNCYADPETEKHGFTLMRCQETKEVVGIKVYGLYELIGLRLIEEKGNDEKGV